MPVHRTLVSLGFTSEPFPAGTHICQVYGDDAERENALLKFLFAGVRAGERTACFSDQTGAARIAAYLADQGGRFDQYLESGLLKLSGTHQVYFQDNEFNPERMLGLLENFYKESMEAGYPAARVIGEMEPKIHEVQGGNRLFEYESRVTQLVERCPVTSVCQYNLHEFDGTTIMDVIKVHPLMFIRGAVVRNPFFVPPEKFLAAIQEAG